MFHQKVSVCTGISAPRSIVIRFSGVHFTTTMDGSLLMGPNASIAVKRKGYTPTVTPVPVTPSNLCTTLDSLISKLIMIIHSYQTSLKAASNTNSSIEVILLIALYDISESNISKAAVTFEK